jgi:hypothetical protein
MLPKTRQKIKIRRNSKGMKAAIKAEKSIIKAKNAMKYDISSPPFYLIMPKQKESFNSQKSARRADAFCCFYSAK